MLYWKILLFKTSGVNTLDIETSAPIEDRKLWSIDLNVAVIYPFSVESSHSMLYRTYRGITLDQDSTALSTLDELRECRDFRSAFEVNTTDDTPRPSRSREESDLNIKACM